MKRMILALTLGSMGVAHQAHAFCMPGEVQSCFVNGQEGQRICGDNARFGPCIPFFAPPPPAEPMSCPVTAPAPADRSPAPAPPPAKH